MYYVAESVPIFRHWLPEPCAEEEVRTALYSSADGPACVRLNALRAVREYTARPLKQAMVFERLLSVLSETEVSLDSVSQDNVTQYSHMKCSRHWQWHDLIMR